MGAVSIANVAAEYLEAYMQSAGSHSEEVYLCNFAFQWHGLYKAPGPPFVYMETANDMVCPAGIADARNALHITRPHVCSFKAGGASAAFAVLPKAAGSACEKVGDQRAACVSCMYWYVSTRLVKG